MTGIREAGYLNRGKDLPEFGQVFFCCIMILHVLPEEGTLFVVAADGLFADDIDVEHVGDRLVILTAVAVDLAGHTLRLQEFIHRLGCGAQEIVAGSGDMGGGIAAVDGFQHKEPGIICAQLLAQVIQMDTLTLTGGLLCHIVHTAV